MIRTYRGGDETALIQSWNRAMPADGITEKVLINRILTDPNFNPEGFFIAEEDGHIVGGLLAIVRNTPMFGTDLEPHDGWITTFFVDPLYRRQGIGRALLEHADAFFTSHARQTVYFASYAPNYFVPGIDAESYPEGAQLLRAMGYQRLYQAVAMDKNLVGFAIPDDVQLLERERQAEGYLVEPLTLPYLTAVLQMNHEEFDADWSRSIREALKVGVPMRNVLIARKDSTVVGFCLYGGYDGIGERFGPFGVSTAVRGTGLGKILLYRCLEQMRHDGLHSAWFLWTGEKEAAGHLYRRAGFTVTRRFDVMKKTLP